MTRFYTAALIALITLWPALAGAQSPSTLGQFGGWTAYQLTEGGKSLCFMTAKPQKDEGNYKKRGAILASIAHRPAEGTKNTFSYAAGYAYKPGSDVTITIDGQSFKLFTDNETAWTSDQATDDTLAKAVQQGASMIVTGTSSRGTLTKDTFSLKGSGDAYAAISKACGL